MKKYLGLIYLSYGTIILYTLIAKTLKNYLSPQLQIYIKIAFIPLIIIGLVLCFNRKVNYKFKISDLILIIPIIMIIISGDGLLSLGLAENRSSNLMNREQNTATKVTEPITIEEQPIETYDFSKPDFEVVDANYEGLANYITFSEKPENFVGKTIKLKGFTVKYASYLPEGMFALGKYIITCCAADAAFGGFYIKYDLDKINHNKWYEIEGVLEQGVDKEGYSIIYIRVINIKTIDSSKEEQYIYPCYVYDDGLCKEVLKYNIEY